MGKVSRSTCILMVLTLVIATTALAGEYHYQSNLNCQECHTMHYSQSHQYDSALADAGHLNATPQADMAGGAKKYLLRNSDSDLCLSCHDGQTFAPDVKGDETPPTGGAYIREAGALTTGGTNHENYKGHTLGVSATPPGGTMSITLQCTNCHEPHGNANYRNLDGSSPVITYAKGSNNITKDVFLRSWSLGVIATNYSVDNVDFNEPDSTKSAMGQFCKGCHTDFHGKSGDSNMGSTSTGWLHHPTADADIGASVSDYKHSSLDVFKSRVYRAKVMSPTGDWGTQGTAWASAPSDLTPTCITCHKSHGNRNPFGLIYLSGTNVSTTLSEEGDTEGNSGTGSGMRKLCNQCHAQGGVL